MGRKQVGFLEAVADFVADNWQLVLIPHIWITTFMLISGENGLEWYATTWFYAPLIAGFTVPCRYGFGKWVERNFRRIYVLSWIASLTIVPWLLWRPLHDFDRHITHPAREALGQYLGLGGQTNLVIVVSTIATLALLLGFTRAKGSPTPARKATRQTLH